MSRNLELATYSVFRGQNYPHTVKKSEQSLSDKVVRGNFAPSFLEKERQVEMCILPRYTKP